MIEKENGWLTQIMDMLEQHFGEDTEFVLHDLKLPYEHTIADIRNGSVTGRKIGDSGDNLGLEVIRGTVKNGNKFNYINFTDKGQVLRSSTLFLRDAAGEAVCALAINEDITKLLELEKYLERRNGVHTRQPDVIIRDVNKLLDSLIQEAQLAIGKTFAGMTREDKQQFIGFLDQRGAFLITKSGPRICELLGISKYTLYGILDVTRKSDGSPEALT